MKPSWTAAPDWANYLARDEDGKWHWYELKPNCLSHWWDTFHPYVGGRCEEAGSDDEWSQTLETKPEN